MIQWIKALFQIPVFADEEKNRLVRPLYILILTILLGMLLITFGNLMVRNFSAVYPLAVILITFSGLLYTIRRGHIQFAGLIMLLLLITLVTLVLSGEAGIHDVGVVTYATVIVLASLVLDRRWFFIVVGLTILAVAFLAWGEIWGWFTVKPVTQDALPVDFFTLIVILLVTTVGVGLLASGLRRSLYQAQVEIAERKRFESEIRRLNDQLEERVRLRTEELEQKNNELESFTYTVSHDLKAPLRAIDGYSRFLREDYFDVLDEEGRLFIDRISSSVDRMNDLIEGLLLYSRMERRPVIFSQTDLKALVIEVLSAYQETFQDGEIELVVDVPALSVQVDPDGLKMVLRNLIDNAIKFTSEVSSPHIEIGCQQHEAARCVLWVKDNGIGLDMAYADKIFEIFHRLNPAEQYPGTGIGLSLVRKAMQRMGGQVRVESTLGEGAVFFLDIPT